MIAYRRGNELDLDVVIALYRDSTLGARRPIDDRERMRAMLANANLVITAWDEAEEGSAREGGGTTAKLVGISRSISDFAYCTYLSDLAVHVDYQRKGIGKELMRRTQEAGGRATVFLFAAPAAVEYYPHVGFVSGSGWMLTEKHRIR